MKSGREAVEAATAPNQQPAKEVDVAPANSTRSPSKLLAEWFWTDRWIGSSAFGLPLEARGLYREMLTQAWRRGARLPNDHDQIRRMAGVTASEWRRTWPLVERFWRVDGDVLVNDTQIEIYTDTAARTKRASEHGLSGARARHRQRQSDARAQPEDQPPSLSPSPERTKNEREIAREGEPFDSFEPSIDQQPDGQAWFTILRDTYPAERVTDNRETVDAFLHELGPVAEWSERFHLMLLTLAEHKASEQWQVPKFAPNLITWLKRGDWRGTRKLAKAGRVEHQERRSWLDECADLAHEPSCNSDSAHQLRKQVAAKGCTHPGVCQSFGEHQQRCDQATQLHKPRKVPA